MPETPAVLTATEAMRAVMQADESSPLRGTPNWAHRIARAVEAAVLAKVASQAPAQKADIGIPISHLAAKQQAERNQCDGCAAGMPLEGDMHRNAGRAEMLCQRGLYEAQQADIGIPTSHLCCPKCKATSGNDWSHCIKPCPMGGPQE